MPRSRVRTRSPEVVAAELLDRFAASFPLDVEWLAEMLDCEVVREPMRPEVSGLLIRDSGRTVIALNEADRSSRQRFTTAHEIGHLMLHPGRPLLVDADVRVNARTPTAGFATEFEETEANRFAAALLMPAYLVRDKVDDFATQDAPIDSVVIRKLAHAFDVSSSAMSIRLVNLGLYIPE